MKFGELYAKLLSDKRQMLAGLSGNALKILPDLQLPEKWFEAMAICEVAVDTGQLDDNVLNLRREMFRFGKEIYVSFGLDNEDYAEWFERVTNLNIKLAEANVAEAWTELSSLYDTARFPFKNEKKAEEYIRKALEIEDPFGLALYGYHLYYGIGFAKVDKERGKSLMLKAKEKNFEKADVYLLLSEYDSDIDPDVYERKIIDYIEKFSPRYQLRGLLGNFYEDKRHDLEKSMQAYEQGIEIENDYYCKQRKAMLILHSDNESEYDVALDLLKEVAAWNPPVICNYIGQFYSRNATYFSPETAMEWFRKAADYYSPGAMYDIAIIHLYHSDHKNIDKGMEYLDKAIELGFVKAMNEKAVILLDGDLTEKNLPEAERLLRKSYGTGDDYAAFRIGVGYQIAEFSETPDYRTAAEYYLEGEKRGSVVAMEFLGRYYKNGLIGKPEPEKAVEYFEKAIEKGSFVAKYDLALCYEDGVGVDVDKNMAFKLLESAAENAVPAAALRLGYYFLNGVAVAVDTDKAFEYFSEAAENGNADALYNLGRMYKYAVGRPENSELALQYLRQASEKGDVDACIEMGLSYECEYGGLECDIVKAADYMRRAADSNHPFAQYKLGCYYYYDMINSENDSENDTGLEYIRMAYENGSAQASLVMGDFCLYDGGADIETAFRYYKQAAEHDFISEGIGLCYFFGIGVEKNEKEAFRYFSIAADRNYIAAKYRLGLCYKYGKGVKRNPVEAYRVMLAAAEDENIAAKYEVGMMLLNGEGTQADPEKGVVWLMKAAEREYDEAQFELGNCYLMGNGVDENEMQALYWYRKAAENGNAQAKKITGKR
jgi:TPR repeat protein